MNSSNEPGSLLFTRSCINDNTCNVHISGLYNTCFNPYRESRSVVVSTLAWRAGDLGSIPEPGMLYILGVKTWLSTLETVSLGLSEETKSCWSLLSGVCARGSKRSNAGGKCVTCRGLHTLA